MPSKFDSNFKHFYYKDKYGKWHEVTNSSSDDIGFRDCSNALVVNGHDVDIAFRSNKTLNRLMTEVKHWENRIARRVKREKRLKEQERRSKLKWRALHT